MPPVGFETTISAGERPKTHALDRAAIGTGNNNKMAEQNWKCLELIHTSVSNIRLHICYKS